MRSRLRFEPAHTRFDERPELDDGQLICERARVDPCELEEILDQRREAPSLILQGSEVFRGVGEAVLDRFEHGGDRRDRGPQVVARGGDELAAGVEERLEVPRHLVERAPEVGKLARPVLGRTGCEIPRCEQRRRGSQALDTPGDRSTARA